MVKNENISRETESLLITVRNNDVLIKYITVKIDNTSKRSKFR